MPPHEETEPTAFRESTPLLDEQCSTLPVKDDAEVGGCSSKATGPQHPHCDSLWRDELLALVKLSLPIIGTYLLEMFPGIVSIILVGHIQNDENREEKIDATAMAVMFMSLTAISVCVGLGTALDTLCSQAYGARETHRMGTFLQTGVLVLTAFLILVAILFYYCAEILIALGQPPAVSKLAGICVLYLLPGVPFLFFYELLRKVLQAQNVAKPMLYVSVVANLVNLGVGWWLVYHSTWGWLGAAMARTACNMCFPLLLLPYIIGSGFSKTFWTGIHLKEAVYGIPQFLTLGVPGVLQVCFEWWGFEVLSLLCGLLPDAVLAIGANAVILNIASMMYMFYLGLSIACNVRVGNALGANDPHRARVTATLTLGMAGITGAFCATFLFSCRSFIPGLLTHDEEINKLSTRLIMVAAVFQIPDSINGSVQGVFRGSGRQSLGAKLNFVAYYFLGLPLAILFAFGLHQGVVGLWTGMTASLLLIAICGTILISRSDWKRLSEQAQERIKSK